MSLIDELKTEVRKEFIKTPVDEWEAGYNEAIRMVEQILEEFRQEVEA